VDLAELREDEEEEVHRERYAGCNASPSS